MHILYKSRVPWPLASILQVDLVIFEGRPSFVEYCRVL